MTKYLTYPQFPLFFADDENGEEGYLEMFAKTVNQLKIQNRLVNGSRKNKKYVFIRSGEDLRIFASELFSRTRLQLVNGHTRNPVVPGEEGKTLIFHVVYSPTGKQRIEAINKMPLVVKPPKEFKPGAKLPLPKNLMFRFYIDPGHGWLAVKMNLLYALGIHEQISDFSYRTGGTAYLEEDDDMGTFVRAMEARGTPWDEIASKVKYTHLETSPTGNYIRRMPHYSP